MKPSTTLARLVPLAAAAALLVLAQPGLAQLYKYVDKDGKTVYTDKPPQDQEGKQIKIQASPPAAPQKTALERDKELDKGRKKSADEGKKSDDAARNAAKTEEACARARENYARYGEGGRITKLNAQGERVYLDEAEIAAGRERSRRDMEELCKKS
jgi:hypothetical protein